IGVENYADMRFKDTARNIRETGEFTVHICDDALVDQMEVCAIKFGPEVDELSEAGLATIAGSWVRTLKKLNGPAFGWTSLLTVVTSAIGRGMTVPMR
ncbi:flavin reductase family protein, partial [Rhizobium leguminosarum]|uniref:flavin reductase family protein n=1 Tax=Rhizobium leguminosarum TaxID=384 RepID=UPI003F97CB91